MKDVIVKRTSRVVIAWLGAALYKVSAKSANGLTTTWLGPLQTVYPHVVKWHIENVAAPGADDTWLATDWLRQERDKLTAKGAP